MPATVPSGTSRGRRDDAPTVRRDRAGVRRGRDERIGDDRRSRRGVSLAPQLRHTASFCLHPAVTGANRTPPTGREAGRAGGGWDLDPHPYGDCAPGVPASILSLLFSRAPPHAPRVAAHDRRDVTPYPLRFGSQFLYPNTSSETAATVVVSLAKQNLELAGLYDRSRRLELTRPCCDVEERRRMKFIVLKVFRKKSHLRRARSARSILFFIIYHRIYVILHAYII